MKSLDQEIRRVLKEPRVTPVDRDDGTLSYLGYPHLYQIAIYLRVPGVKRWRADRSIEWPASCCVCENAAEKYLPYTESKTGLPWKRANLLLDGVPHCRQHGQAKQAELVVSSHEWGDAVRLLLVGRNASFLHEVEDLNKNGDVVPPWLAFPDLGPESSGWRQGDGEAWFNSVWEPFFHDLSNEKKERYLNYYCAPEVWRTAHCASCPAKGDLLY